MTFVDSEFIVVTVTKAAIINTIKIMMAVIDVMIMTGMELRRW